jgi:predicted transcriptional regulator
MINNLLQQLGFSEKEITVYLTVLENGKITPAQVSEITKIKRTTVYAVAKDLIRRGVITEDQSGASSYLLALPPTDLANSIQKEEAELEEKKKVVEEAIEGLKTVVKNTKYSIPKMVFISEGELEMYLYKQSSIWSESIKSGDGIWWGFQDPSFLDSYRKWVDWYWIKGNTQDISLQLLTNKSEIEKELKDENYPKRKVKLWQGGQAFTSTIWINGDYIVMINTSQRPHYLVEIHDAVMAHNLRELFKSIWSSTEIK